MTVYPPIPVLEQVARASGLQCVPDKGGCKCHEPQLWVAMHTAISQLARHGYELQLTQQEPDAR